MHHPVWWASALTPKETAGSIAATAMLLGRQKGMDVKIPALTKSCVLASVLALGVATAANAELEKEGSSQTKPYESRDYPGATPETGYGTSGDTQERRYRERSGTDSGQHGSGQYSGDDSYDHTGNEGTGPRLKGRY